MATFNIPDLNSILSTLPLYKSEQVKDDLGRGLNDRAYQTLFKLAGSQYGEALNKIFKGDIGGAIGSSVGGQLGQILGGIFGGPGTPSGTTGTAGEAGAMIQQTSVGKDKGAFKWVQENLTPEMFMTADSCFVAFGKPLYNNNDTGTDFKLVGVCQSINLNVGVNVLPLKELRGERTLIFPLKSTPSSLTMSRLLTTGGNISALTRAESKWAYDTQLAKNKQLFGVLIAFMTPGRTQDIAALYAERCAITNMSIGINANNFVLTESVSIIFDRLKDDAQATDADMTRILQEQNIMNGNRTPIKPDSITTSSSLIESYYSDYA